MRSPTTYLGVVRPHYAAECQRRENAALVSVPGVVVLCPHSWNYSWIQFVAVEIPGLNSPTQSCIPLALIKWNS